MGNGGSRFRGNDPSLVVFSWLPLAPKRECLLRAGVLPGVELIDCCDAVVHNGLVDEGARRVLRPLRQHVFDRKNGAAVRTVRAFSIDTSLHVRAWGMERPSQPFGL
ncbi:hypothetical protein GCM10010862_10390 [Devosia nitrariae]|uniref:Uncharacterized protein n=1 Tax=Devosia nitrariae TaxID=2071872 RepID=A0ABQ5W133_9HYPH|nr:hypothetical protein GCM10010862_10390 [Devosia nitrariae]